MYNFLKSRLKSIVPRDFLFRNELVLRNIYGQFYKGTTYHCNICKRKLRSFITLPNSDQLCPFCGSLSRNRRLWHLLNNKELLKGDVLHFSPSRCLYRELKKNQIINYVSTDFENEFIADLHLDITDISADSNSFDLIICYHVLEHIEQDEKAIEELYRVLKPSGKLLIQTPYKKGSTYEDPTIRSRGDRKLHFGQEDHVRVYSKKDLKYRLEKKGFIVLQLDFAGSRDEDYYGLISPETIFECSILTK